MFSACTWWEGSTPTESIDETSWQIEDSSESTVKQAWDNPDEIPDTQEDVVLDDVQTFEEIVAWVEASNDLSDSEQKNILVKTGDYYGFQDDIDKSLNAYKRADEISWNNDEEIALRIARILVKKRRYWEAVEYYERSSDINLIRPEDRELYAQAVSRSLDIDFQAKLAVLDIGEQIRYQYDIGSACKASSDTCIEKISSVLAQDEFVNDLKETLEWYENLGVIDSAFRDTLLAEVFIKHGHPDVTVEMTRRTLQDYPSYLAPLLLSAQAHYETGKYEEAIKLLSQYRETNLEDPHATYMQGLAYFETGDIQLTNTLLNEAIRLGLQPKAPAERKLAYTYFLLGRTDNMFAVLGYLLENEAFTEQDATNALYLALTHYEEWVEDDDTWTQEADPDEDIPIDIWFVRAIDKYPDSSSILSLRGWHEYQQGNFWLAIRDLKRSIALDRQNPLAYFQLGRIYFQSEKYELARSNFQQVSILDAGGIFWNQVLGYLKQMIEK